MAMFHTRRSLMVAFGVVAALCINLPSLVFVPPPGRHAASTSWTPAAAAIATLAGTSPVFADQIGEAAKKLGVASYPLLKQWDWVNNPEALKYFVNYGPKLASTKAVRAILKDGIAMDPQLIKNAVAAHRAALVTAGPDLVTTQEGHIQVIDAIARMIASAPPEKTLAVFRALKEVGLQEFIAGNYATLNSNDAQAAFSAFLELGLVVKDNR